MKKPTTRNERYFMSTGKYKSEKDREFDNGKGKWGKEFKLKNATLVELTRVFRKLTTVEMDFDNMEEMTKLIEDTIVIENALKVYTKLEEKLREIVYG